MNLTGKNFIGGYLRACRRHNPEGLAFIYGEERLTWSDLVGRCFQLVTALRGLGVEPHDRVAFMFHNCPPFLEVNLAAQLLGAVPVPLNFRFSPREVAWQVQHCGAKVFILEEAWADVVNEARPSMDVKHLIIQGKATPDWARPYEDLLGNGPSPEPDIPTSPDDVAVIIYTGGTTGRSKGVMLTYQAHVDLFARLFTGLTLQLLRMNIEPQRMDRLSATLPVPGLALAYSLLSRLGRTSLLTHPLAAKALRQVFQALLSRPVLHRVAKRRAIRWMTPSFPLFHDASYQILMMAVLTGALTLVQPAGVSFSPTEVFRLIERERPFFLANVPAGWKMLVNAPDRRHYDRRSVAVAATGASPCPPSLKKAIFETFPGVIIMDLLGQTEMTPITSVRIDTGVETIKDRSVGLPIVPTRIVDEEGHDVPRGEVGEIVYRSETMMKGYYKEDAQTKQSQKDGWFYSGDLGYRDESGEIRMVGRRAELINSGGEKVYPQEVEEVLLEMDQLDKACVIGVDHPTWGQAVRAVVVPKPGASVTEKEIMDFARPRLAGYKRPRSVVITDSLPITPVGKVRRAQVVELFGRPDEGEKEG